MISLTDGDFTRVDAENSVLAELARLRGNIVRSRGVVTKLNERYPSWGLLEFFEEQLLLIVCGPSAQPAASASTGAAASPAPS